MIDGSGFVDADEFPPEAPVLPALVPAPDPAPAPDPPEELPCGLGDGVGVGVGVEWRLGLAWQVRVLRPPMSRARPCHATDYLQPGAYRRSPATLRSLR